MSPRPKQEGFEKMRFIVAIDWKLKDGYTFLELEAKTELQAMIEAPAVACSYTNMGDVWCLRLLTQTKKEARAMEATTLSHIFFPSSYIWKDGESGITWHNIEVVKK